MSSESPLLFGRYQLLELIARGGMAEVFKAKSYGVEGFEKQVVLKRILPSLAQNQQFVEMFLHEARLSVALSHANIVQVFDLGREEDTYFIAMEYVRGRDLAQVLRECRGEGREVPVEMAVYIACEVARALDYAHRRRDAHGQVLGVVHRDISPQNVLLSFEGEVKVTDFGIAKARNTIEAQGVVRGKYGYMSPEQARGEAVDARADVYALGVTLFEMLAGQNPFVSARHHATTQPQDVLARVIAGRHTALESLRKGVPDEVRGLIAATMSVDRGRRPATAAKVYEELTAFLYTLGVRVGPNDLAEWLKEVGTQGPASVTDVEGIQAAFDDYGGDALEPEIEELGDDVELEEIADEPAVDVVAVAGGSMRPLDERRPVVILSALLSGASVTLARSCLEAMVASADRHAATVFDRREGGVVLGFGARAPDGREATLAANVALLFQQIVARTAPGVALGIGLTSATVRVDFDGQAVDDDALAGAVASARALAITAKDRVLAVQGLAGVISEGFETEALSDGGVRLIEARAEVRRRVVGRQEPFKALGDSLARAATSGLQVVEVVGEAGVGKTRFLAEVHYRLRRQNHKVTWHVATCLSHEREVPLAAMQGMLRELLGVEEVDPEAVVREKARRVRELGLSPEEMLAVGVVLGVVSASIESIDSASRPLRSAMQKIAMRLAEDRLTVLVWDAAEYMDELSATMLSELIERAARSRLVVVISARRGRKFAWHQHASTMRIELEPLTEDEAWQLVAQRLGTGVLPGDLIDDLWQKTQGNPFALEEYLKTLIDLRAVVVRDEGIYYDPTTLEEALPDTLRGLVASRVSRLPATQRTVLQVAAVIGPRLYREQLIEAARLRPDKADTALAGLVATGFLEHPGPKEYRFISELVCDVLYDGLEREARAVLHATVAEVTERLLSDRLDEFAERLAHHHELAGETERALHFLVRAAKRQLIDNAPDAAVSTLEHAIALSVEAGQGAREVLGLYALLAEAALSARDTDRPSERLQLGVSLAESTGERGWVARLVLLQGRLCVRRHQMVEAVRTLERAMALGDAVGDTAVRAGAVASLGAVHAERGEFRKALRYLEEAVKLAESSGLARERARGLAALARCRAACGDEPGARTALDALGALDTEVTSEPTLGVELSRTRAEVLLGAREVLEAIDAAQVATDLAREVDRSLGLAVCCAVLGEACWRGGDLGRSYAAFTEAKELADQRGFVRLAARADAYMAFLEGMRDGGEKAQVEARLDAARALFDAEGFVIDGIEVRYLAGLLAVELGDSERARRLLREALTKAGATEARRYVDDCEAALRRVGASIRPQQRQS